MTEKARDFQVIEGTPEKVDWTHILEEMDARDALPILRQMSRRMKPAANSALAVVEQGSQEASQKDPGEQSSNGPV
jgi:hypothetical protein